MKEQAASIYQEEKKKFEDQLATLKKKQNLFGWLRLGIVIITAIIAFYLFNSSIFFGVIIVIIGITLFLFIVSLDTDNNNQIENRRLLIRINQEEIDSLNGNYAYKYDGIEYLPAVHDYAADLDLFGQYSLYQLINRANTEQGKSLFAHNFLNALPVADIKQRHEAVQELASLYEWRQQLQALSLKTNITITTQKRAEEWLRSSQYIFDKPFWKVFIAIYSVFAVASAIAAALGYIPTPVFSLLFIFYFFFSGFLSKKTISAHHHLDRVVPEIDAISEMIKWIEEKGFQSPLLNNFQASVRDGETGAYSEIRQLKNILNRFELKIRSSLVFLIINSFLLWDVRQMRGLNAWKKRNKERLQLWYDLIASFEVLNSLANIQFNYSDWVLPNFANEYFHLDAKSLGHPLIKSEKRVLSDFSINGFGKVALITGSNMAGKSTFLRSLGVNIVLAQIGAPVCATAFTLSPNKLMSSMRISDNLAENTSTFYAELRKLKTIIEAVNRHEPVFILLDEILRGTNSLDKHTGSEALVRQLIKHQAVAILATHDVELSKLEKEFPGSLENYHFDVQVAGEELYFDYKLKYGVCTSLNASILMKKIGIEV
jgi:ABC-type multidrug transport system fused ATPase/permease subunit